MGQVTIYLDNETESKLKRAAKSSHLSVSKWIASIIKEKITTEWPQDVINLAGAWKDKDFPSIDEIRSNPGQDMEREEL
jgi:predicted transcriptional regulator